MMNSIIKTKSEKETIKLASEFSSILKSGDVVLLHGDLGMGKSVFCRSLIRAICNEEALEVPSPTFTLVQNYDYSDGVIWHFDLYRLGDPSEIYELGWDDALSDGIMLVEWPSRLGGLLPLSHIDVTITAISGEPDSREIEIKRYE